MVWSWQKSTSPSWIANSWPSTMPSGLTPTIAPATTIPGPITTPGPTTNAPLTASPTKKVPTIKPTTIPKTKAPKTLKPTISTPTSNPLRQSCTLSDLPFVCNGCSLSMCVPNWVFLLQFLYILYFLIRVIA